MIVDIPTQLAQYYNEDNTFSQYEMQDVIEKYVCPVCYGQLSVMWIPNFERVLIVCPDHGNVCQIGRITHATVSIQGEAAYQNYHKAIRNLPDLWGDLIDEGFERNQAHKITQYFVCEVCGGFLVMESRSDSPKMDVVNIVCSRRHGNINQTGYVRKKDFVSNFQREKAWEKQMRESKGTTNGI